MWTPTLVLIAITTLAACVALGGGLYEFLVVDPTGQAAGHRSADSRRHIPAPVLDSRAYSVRVLLIVALIVGWDEAGVRIALLVALLSHAAMRIWSLVDFVPKAVEFEKTDPAVVDEAAAVRWTRRSLLRLPLDLIACAADGSASFSSG